MNKDTVIKKPITNQTFGEERALYGLKDTLVSKCSFSGEEDGESALKEARNIKVSECELHLRYPLWHVEGYGLWHDKFFETSRAPIWYSHRGYISNCEFHSVKALRECTDTEMQDCKIFSEEFGWKCKGIRMYECQLEGAYAFFDSKSITVKKMNFRGKYSFQYVDGLTIEDSILDTKDAFWHSKNVTVRNSVVKGEYLGWFSEGLTLDGCKIIGTQPLCYCKNLRLIDCEMVDTDLSFEYSDVKADIKGDILSVKNPRSGCITADSVGEIIFEDSVIDAKGKVVIRGQAVKKQ